MSTLEERHNAMLKMVSESDLGFVDSLRAVYHWTRTEWLAAKVLRMDAKVQKHVDEYNKLVDVANFLHELQDL